MSSKLPSAERFKDWVCEVVLPTIRKDSVYIKGEENLVTGELEEAELYLKVMHSLTAKVARLAVETKKQVSIVVT
ncbi:hypothetical protein [Candidatus Enterovibrio escicola]|uniref:hypothetical protein n=1 Tax=Candidatus Enterovibrio escicola TaxID=1927127 RepID=UPI001F534396